ncbi:MAG: Na+/H+ antiporter subunit E [Ilumatobacteraceae bacterium]
MREWISAQWLRNTVLLAFWLGLWGQISVANVVSGVAAIATVRFIAPTEPTTSRIRIHPIGVIALAGRMVWDLVTSSLNVAMLSLVPNGPRRASSLVVEHEMADADPFVVTTMTQMIGVTPGTLVTGIERRGEHAVLEVHGLGIEQGALRAQVTSLEARVRRGFEVTS